MYQPRLPKQHCPVVETGAPLLSGVTGKRRTMTKIPSDFDVLRYAHSFGGRHPTELLPRETVREVTCPSCNAEPGHPCWGTSGLRERNHSSRCFERVRLLMLGEQRCESL
jgi:hypothetical protein